MPDAFDDQKSMVEGGSVITRLDVTGSTDSVVLLDPDRRPDGVQPWHPFRNVLRITPTGHVRWRAEIVPGETTAKCWTGIARDTELIATTYSYECDLDVDTGRIVRTTFTK